MRPGTSRDPGKFPRNSWEFRGKSPGIFPVGNPGGGAPGDFPGNFLAIFPGSSRKTHGNFAGNPREFSRWEIPGRGFPWTIPGISRELHRNFPENPGRVPGDFPWAPCDFPGKFPEMPREFPGTIPGVSQELPGEIPGSSWGIPRDMFGNLPGAIRRSLDEARQQSPPPFSGRTGEHFFKDKDTNKNKTEKTTT